MFLSERYAVTLGVLALYLGLLDGFLKLKTGSQFATLGRDILLYAIVLGALARFSMRANGIQLPPLSGWILAFTLLVLVGIFNPGSYPILHGLASVRPHLEFVPLFFFGYEVMRTRKRLRMFLVLLLICGAANGIVNFVQFNLTPAQLAAWGPGYNNFINGSGGLAGRTFDAGNGVNKVRPFGLGGDAGGGGLIAVLAIPGAIALIGSAWRRPRYAAIAVALSVGAVTAVVTSQGRGVVIAAFVMVLAYAVLAVSARRLVPTLAGLLVGGTIAVLVISAIGGGSNNNTFTRYNSITPGKLLTTTQEDRGSALSIVPTYIKRFPLGNGLGTGGPATGFARSGQTTVTSGGLSAESEFSFLVLEMGVLGLIILVGFTIRLLALALTRLRRVPDHETRTLLAAIVSPLFGVFALYIGGPATAGSPLGPYLWFTAGIMSYWLMTGGRQEQEPRALTVPHVVPEVGPPRAPASVLRRQEWRPPTEGTQGPARAASSPAPSPGPRLIVAYKGAGGATDAILDYSRRLTEEIDRSGRADAELVAVTPDGRWAAGNDFDGVLLQYNPFSYGRWGFAPWLPRALRRLRDDGHPVAVMVHEAFVRPTRGRQHILRTWQRVQLRAVLRAAGTVFAPTQALVESLREIDGTVVPVYLPVGSNIPDRREARDAVRRRLGIGDDTVVLAAFGTGHPSQLRSWIARAASAAAATGARVVVLNLGSGVPPVAGMPPGIDVHTPGELAADELAEWLSAGDVFIAPFSDGVSTRRTTLMAALQHGLAVVATRGPNTDSLLVEGDGTALRLVGGGKPDELEAVVAELTSDVSARRALGAGGRLLYAEHFGWPVIAAGVLAALVPVLERRRRG
jgi:glycosyltransferase involved in cell wall biosynthesis